MPEASPLFEAFKLGSTNLSHRIALAPCTRLRGEKLKDFWIPGDLMVEYYSQRASEGGLLLTEACPISATACGYLGSAGIFTPEQIAGWKRVTDAVHKKGGKIYCQLWHVGRATVAQLIGGIQPISAVSTPIKGPSFVPGVDYADAPPRAMFGSDFEEIIQNFVDAAKIAINDANFDGVEVHGANGYLLDQFFHDNVNTRKDEYGGSIENRVKFPLQVLEAVIAAVGGAKTGIRLSPYNFYQDTKDSDPNKNWAYICEKIADLKETVSYVHMIEPRFDEVLSEEDKLKSLEDQVIRRQEFSLDPFRNILKARGIAFIRAGGFSKEDAIEKLSAGKADIIAFGRSFLSNPDLVDRYAKDLALSKYDRSTFYGSNPPNTGYTDYPVFAESELAA
ncbi:unnamed protein product [Kuraishia capsulata CBS 1993]|uniref:NADH:flavin oxidoreductase/NADH oxidase N-terminal domain-containing protein n=1 Tax=Kuraishia capsulata CBS 1993 TaxID=1382522 RepID=W6MKV6_9ASCO|nr:uncharacterized protein KUCA_T00001371001 [Kuraishia capsulata CBS 1993]CDK25402.1 unnamed protein product [Kuraishia capsulata CBS 1993]